MPAIESLPRPSFASVSTSTADPERPAGGSRRRLVALAVAVVAAAAVAAALLLNGGGAERLEIGKPRAVSAAQLSSYAESAGRPVYWAGDAAAGFKLELTEAPGQRVFVRYLTADAKAGDPRAAFTTVATYPMQDAYGRLEDSADRAGAVEGKTSGGAITLYYKKAPENVYVAHPGSDRLVEVFAPQEGAALQLATSPSLVEVR